MKDNGYAILGRVGENGVIALNVVRKNRDAFHLFDSLHERTLTVYGAAAVFLYHRENHAKDFRVYLCCFVAVLDASEIVVIFYQAVDISNQKVDTQRREIVRARWHRV